MAETDEDKQYEPSQKKLDDARKKGEIAKSVDLTTASSYAGFLLVALAIGAASIQELGSTLMGMIGRADTLSEQFFSGGAESATATVIGEVFSATLPWFLLPAVAVLVSLFAQRAFVVAPSKLEPKLSRISILSNAKNKFGRAGLFEFAKSFTKLSLYSLILGVYLSAKLPVIIATISLTPGMVMVELFELCIGFLLIVLAVSATIGAIDFLFQRAEHMRKNRMSHKEMRDEHKDAEGDPHVKQQRRQKAYDIAMNKMLQDVPSADVVIVNPTHYAVALKWDRALNGAPVCVAKGVDEIAAKIREVANKNGVPIHRDPPTARALYATVELGNEVEPEHYQAVAAAIRFAETMRERAGQIK